MTDAHGERGELNGILLDVDPGRRRALSSGLTHHGFSIAAVADRGQALELLAADPARLALLLVHDPPSVETRAACSLVRAQSAVPIVVLVDRELGWRTCVDFLEAGADDVIPITAEPRELIARIAAIVRRARRGPLDAPAATTVSAGPIEIDLVAHTVRVNGVAKSLTRKEFEVLCVLSSHPGATAPREQLARRVWRRDPLEVRGLDHTLDSHITSLRSKLGVRALIKTVRGVGYRVETAAKPVIGPRQVSPTSEPDK